MWKHRELNPGPLDDKGSLFMFLPVYNLHAVFIWPYITSAVEEGQLNNLKTVME
jgi:hypothetical protein